MLPFGWIVLLKIFPPEMKELPLTKEEVTKKIRDLGRASPGEVKTLAIFATTITLWVATPLLSNFTNGVINPPIQAVALLGGLSLFLPGINVLSWRAAQRDVDWGGVLLIVGGLSLGLMVFNTGAARWVAHALLGNIGFVPALLLPFVVVIGVALLHLLFSSNTVTGTIIIPILIALAQDLKIDPWAIAAPAAFTSSLAFVLVTESPTNVIPYAAGYFSIRDMAKAGVWMTLVAAVCVTVSIVVVGFIFP